MKLQQMAKKKLEEFCIECGSPMIEDTCVFKGEKLAVSACLKCDFYDWELPKKAGQINTEEEIKVFDESGDWAEEQAKKIKAKFLTQKPVVLKVNCTEKDIEDFLASKKLAVTTYDMYKKLLVKFLDWVRRRKEKRPNEVFLG